VVVCPLGYHRCGWYGAMTKGMDGSDLKEAGKHSEDDVIQVVELVRKEYAIDPGRVYLWGYEMGGAGALHLAMNHPKLWTAVAIVAPARIARIARPAGRGGFVHSLDDLKLIQDVPVLTIVGVPKFTEEKEKEREKEREKDKDASATRVWMGKMAEMGMHCHYVEVEGVQDESIINANQHHVQMVFEFFSLQHEPTRGELRYAEFKAPPYTIVANASDLRLIELIWEANPEIC